MNHDDDISPGARGGTSRVIRYSQDLAAAARAEHDRVGREIARMQARQHQLLIDVQVRETRGVDRSPVYRGRRVLDAGRAAGIRAVHSYPLPDAEGEIRGFLSLYYWRRSAQRGVSGLIAAAAQALRGHWDEPGFGPGREPDQLGAQEAG